MVVALAEEREARRAHGCRQRVHRHEAALRDVPDPAGERMVVAEPRRGRPGRARDGGDDEEGGEGGETSHHPAMIAPRGGPNRKPTPPRPRTSPPCRTACR